MFYWQYHAGNQVEAIKCCYPIYLPMILYLPGISRVHNVNHVHQCPFALFFIGQCPSRMGLERASKDWHQSIYSRTYISMMIQSKLACIMTKSCPTDSAEALPPSSIGRPKADGFPFFIAMPPFTLSTQTWDSQGKRQFLIFFIGDSISVWHSRTVYSKR